MKKARVGILGGAGYTGGELVRILLQHPQVEIAFVQSRSQAGKLLSATHRDLIGETELKFTNDPALGRNPSLDAVFLAVPHGEAMPLIRDGGFSANTRIIDLSNELRMKAASHVGDRHFVYGLPELRREEIKSAKNIANPGCFATAIQLALLPLAAARKLDRAAVTGITGATGAGQALATTAHFAFRSNNIQAYKTLSHQHMGEVGESLAQAAGGTRPKVSFIPWRGDFTRGIFVSALADTSMTRAQALDAYRKFYHSHPFINVCDEPIDLKAVVNTNRALIEIVEGSGDSAGQLAVHCVIDNLIKGASGQAVQNLNLMMGYPEDMGLRLKGVVF